MLLYLSVDMTILVAVAILAIGLVVVLYKIHTNVKANDRFDLELELRYCKLNDLMEQVESLKLETVAVEPELTNSSMHEFIVSSILELEFLKYEISTFKSNDLKTVQLHGISQKDKGPIFNWQYYDRFTRIQKDIRERLGRGYFEAQFI